MKNFMKEFLKRGAVAAAGGPVILAIVYGILGATGVVSALTPAEVCTGILSVTLMAFIAAGINAIYTVEQLPLISSSLIHAGVLYLDYLIMYWLNDWFPRNPQAIGFFTFIFVGGYVLIWLIIMACIHANTKKLNDALAK